MKNNSKALARLRKIVDE
jgi:hypothetical protein